MFMKVYEMVYEVTETCNNGKERRVKKSVFAPFTKGGHDLVQLGRENKGIEVLKKLQYYDIEHVSTKSRVLLFTEESEFYGQS